ncbi:MAG: hypothetical protein NC489_30670 [Ruminococcus flavefaciens]|nr:hypothetical protein [Ruminococcus flavefaciens]
MLVERLENGNFTITREPGEKMCLEEENLAIAILWNIPDMELLGEQGCAGNFDMYQFFYNSYTGKKYMILYGRDGDAFLRGETILLEAQELDDEDREELEKEGIA